MHAATLSTYGSSHESDAHKSFPLPYARAAETERPTGAIEVRLLRHDGLGHGRPKGRRPSRFPVSGHRARPSHCGSRRGRVRLRTRHPAGEDKHLLCFERRGDQRRVWVDPKLWVHAPGQEKRVPHMARQTCQLSFHRRIQCLEHGCRRVPCAQSRHCPGGRPVPVCANLRLQGQGLVCRPASLQRQRAWQACCFGAQRGLQEQLIVRVGLPGICLLELCGRCHGTTFLQGMQGYCVTRGGSDGQRWLTGSAAAGNSAGTGPSGKGKGRGGCGRGQYAQGT